MTSGKAANPDYDVIVLGYGSAGANAALQAANMGAKVLIIEKAEKGGGNSFVSSANMTLPTDFDKKDKSDGAAFTRYLQEVSQGTTPPKVISAFVEGLYEMPAWLKELGGEFEENKFERMWTYYIPALTFPKLETTKGLDLSIYHIKQTERCPAPTAGRRVWGLLDSHLRAHKNVTIRTSTETKSTNRDQSGAISGITLKDGTTITSHSVIMALGGFENNPALKRDLLGPRTIGLLGSPANTGDGLRLARKAGAEIWHHSAEASVLGFLPPGSLCGFALALRRPGFIFVNKRGRRFINEARLESHRGHSDTAALDPESGKYANDPIWLIMDEENVEANESLVLEIFSQQVVVNGYKWSKHSEAEIAKGWVQRASTVEQLEGITGCSARALQETLEQWNSHSDRNPDPLGRDPESLRAINAPYYAVMLTPLLYNTQGGPQRNERAQIVDPDGEVIAGLYGAGECGSVWGHAYQSSTNFAETIVFGRIAGREAAGLAGCGEDYHLPTKLESVQLGGTG